MVEGGPVARTEQKIGEAIKMGFKTIYIEIIKDISAKTSKAKLIKVVSTRSHVAIVQLIAQNIGLLFSMVFATI